MHIETSRPNRRPKLFLPLFLAPAQSGAAGRREAKSFPLSAHELRRAVADRVD